MTDLYNSILGEQKFSSELYKQFKSNRLFVLPSFPEFTFTQLKGQRPLLLIYTECNYSRKSGCYLRGVFEPRTQFSKRNPVTGQEISTIYPPFTVLSWYRQGCRNFDHKDKPSSSRESADPLDAIFYLSQKVYSSIHCKDSHSLIYGYFKSREIKVLFEELIETHPARARQKYFEMLENLEYDLMMDDDFGDLDVEED